MLAEGARAAALVGLLPVLLAVVGGVLAGRTGALVSLVLGVAVTGYGLARADRVVLRSVRAVELAPRSALHVLVADAARTAGVPVPRVLVSPLEAPGALVVGHSPATAALCCTEGLLRLLDAPGLRAVLARELAHVAAGDLLLRTLAAGLAGVVVAPAGLSRTGHHRATGAAALLLVVLGPVAATLLRLGVRSSQAYGSDAAAAREPVARALRAVERATALHPLPQDPRLAAAGALLTASPFRGGGSGRLFGTHPPVADRVARLEAGYR